MLKDAEALEAELAQFTRHREQLNADARTHTGAMERLGAQRDAAADELQRQLRQQDARSARLTELEPRSPTSRSTRSRSTSSRTRCATRASRWTRCCSGSAMSPVIREQHDEFPMLTDPQGRMVVGQFGAYINEMMADWDRGIYPGDVILTSDPYKCSASISHTNDWFVLVPIFFEDELVGWSSQFGHQMDAGGRLPGSLPTGATTIFEEGIIIPPLKIVERGRCRRTSCG